MATKERFVIENCFRIVNKEGEDVDFVLNPAQAKLDHKLTGRDIIPKARQEGISSYVLARFTAKCLGIRNTRAVVISHEKEATQRMLDRVRYYLRNFKGPEPIIKNDSRNEITFPKTNSAFYIGTAGSRKFGRGDTITDLHCSEIAYWPDAKSLVSGLFQAVPRGSGEIFIESTGNGVGNFYHRLCMRAAAGKGRYRLHFFNWQDFPEYSLKLTPEQEKEILSNLDSYTGEPELIREYGLTAGHIAFRREKLEEMDYDVQQFEQEYPLTLDQCFQASGHSIFRKINYKTSDRWEQKDEYMHWLKDSVRRGHSYVMGVDVSAGVRKDRSVMEIFDIENMEQVGEWISDRTAPDHLAVKVKEVAEIFNGAYVIVESNNHGIATLSELRKIYPTYKIYTETRAQEAKSEKSELMTLGHRTTTITKPLLVSKLRKLLAKDLLIHSPILYSELTTFVETEEGRLEAEEGCFDDCVIAAAKAVIGLERAALIAHSPVVLMARKPDPFKLDTIINEMHGRGRAFPIREQAVVIDGEVLESHADTDA